MPDRPNVMTRKVTRDKLASFLKSQELIKFIESLQTDVTETLPNSIVDISSDAQLLLAASLFAPRAQISPDVRGDQFIAVRRDAQGYQLTLSAEQLVAALLPYLPRAQQARSVLLSPDASTILATQIFGT